MTHSSISKRWLAVSTPVLNAFDELINSHANDEPKFQDFLAEHPQLLDPLAIRVWPQPDLFGFREPDYIVQRADGTYMVVEIECPAKKLVTKSNQLSADVTHAEQQVTDYRRNLLQKHADLRIHLPNFQEPDCLVVIGLERALSDGQRQILHDANGSRTYVRIVGFDWLLERARTIASNMAQPKVDVIPLRVV
ncbi:MAG: DUF4263 domain-containing protein [Sphingomonadales bacterium]|nr:MAG: DUF4263 domain-containing protein [Sphingomonadales bacterium]